MAYRKHKNIKSLPYDPSTLAYEHIETDESEFNFMTTVSIPVYDKRDNAVSIELKLILKFPLLSHWTFIKMKFSTDIN